jgi:UDP-3-O-[3-hydroxymyristoyl] glucosamine N-acyltransferase
MPTGFTITSLVEQFGGVCGGDPQRRVESFGSLTSAGPSQLAFVAAARYAGDVPASRASAILVNAAVAGQLPDEAARLWVCRDPYLQFARISQFFEAEAPGAPEGGIDHTALVAADAQVHASASIGPGSVVGRGSLIGAQTRIGAGVLIGDDVQIGAGSLVHPGAIVYPGCRLGERCIVHGGAVIGADGFGFARDGSRWIKIPQVGGVSIGDDVEIGANTTIDRGALDDTIIGNGVKLDNQIQIAHNVVIGDDTIIAACVGVAGSAIIGRRCMIGGAARIMGHVTIVDDTVISTQTFVSRSITKPAQYTGYYPMAEHAAFEKSAAVLRRLDGLRDRVRRLEALLHTASSQPFVPSDSSEPESPA